VASVARFQVAQISKGRAMIEFSGTTTQVQETFHTVHNKVKGDHWANADDPESRPPWRRS
jgi:hypothetical protein